MQTQIEYKKIKGNDMQWPNVVLKVCGENCPGAHDGCPLSVHCQESDSVWCKLDMGMPQGCCAFGLKEEYSGEQSLPEQKLKAKIQYMQSVCLRCCAQDENIGKSSKVLFGPYVHLKGFAPSESLQPGSSSLPILWNNSKCYAVVLGARIPLSELIGFYR